MLSLRKEMALPYNFVSEYLLRRGSPAVGTNVRFISHR